MLVGACDAPRAVPSRAVGVAAYPEGCLCEKDPACSWVKWVAEEVEPLDILALEAEVVEALHC
jgi:hypothetical protein